MRQAYKLIKALSSRQMVASEYLPTLLWMKKIEDAELTVLCTNVANRRSVINQPLVMTPNYKQKTANATIALTVYLHCNLCCQSLSPFLLEQVLDLFAKHCVMNRHRCHHLIQVRLSLFTQPEHTRRTCGPIAALGSSGAVKYNKASEKRRLVTKAKYGMINKLAAHHAIIQRRKITKQLHYPKPKPWYLA